MIDPPPERPARCPTPPCRRRGRPIQLDPDTRTALVLDAAEALMAEQGIDRISMSAIARAAGMSKRTVYELFSSREELISASLRRTLETVFRPLDADETALPLPERLRRILTMHWAPGIEDRSLEVLRTAIAETRRQPELARHLLDNGFSDLSQRIEAELVRGVERGELVVDDIPMAAEILRDMVFENPVAKLLEPRSPSAERQAARELRRDRAIEIVCRGTAPPAAR